MESAGFLHAIDKVGNNILSLVIKGISDPADERKKEIDIINGGIIRKIAMQNSVYILKLFLDNYSFENNEFNPNKDYFMLNLKQSKKEDENNYLEDSLYNYTIKNKIKAPFGIEKIFENESEWNKLFYLISSSSEIIFTKECFIHDIITFILNSLDSFPIKITGLPGSGISHFLSFLYSYLYRYFQEKKTDVYPLYFDFRFYRYKIYEGDSDIIKKAEESLKNDINDIIIKLESRKINNILLLLDGVYDSRFQSSFENIIFDKFSDFHSKKIIGVRDFEFIKHCKETNIETENTIASINFSGISIKNENYMSLLDCFSNILNKENFKKSNQ